MTLRDAAASFYVRSGLPAVSRTVRQHYRLSIGRSARWPKVSLDKRESCARILYYHGVNDDNDPFFPATSTKLFDEQMRYLARYYKVVSVSEILRGLEEGLPEEGVVAITFDDGYRDNYENAFPILQRYGLPATIFLATGGIDSEEPLWFEQLAAAFKNTKKESVEIEMPALRRLPLGTTSARLVANGEVFRFFRTLPDSERRARLNSILAQLGTAGDRERRHKMLTWDQIRLMAVNRIEFGGHTVSHPFLSRLTPAETAYEVSECKRRIEQEIQRPVDTFAYPNGREPDFAFSQKEALQAAGYRAAMTTIWGMNYSSTDRLELRRGGPWEATGALFAWKLDWYQLTTE